MTVKSEKVEKSDSRKVLIDSISNSVKVYMLSFDCLWLMDPKKGQPNFLYKSGTNKIIDGLINPKKK